MIVFLNSLKTFKEANLDLLGNSKGWWKSQNFPEIEDIPEVKEVTKDETSEEEPETIQKTIPGAGSWVVSKTRGTHCLHIVGKCHRKPGKHFKRWIEVKVGVKEDQFKKACRI